MEAKLEIQIPWQLLKHSDLCSNLLQAENETTSDNPELFSAEETLISVTRVVHRGWLFRGNYPTRVIPGASATVGGCPKESIQHGLYRVLRGIQSANIFLGAGTRSSGFRRGDYSEGVGWLGTGIFGGG